MTTSRSAPSGAGASDSPADSASLSCPPRPALVRFFTCLDWALCGLVLGFAFLVSSFVIRNSDFWFHLASGRLLLQGRYVFGVDPFCCTTADVYWANHSWLYDALLYSLHEGIGAAGLVVLKASGITMLAGLLLQLRLPEGSRVVSAGCTALGLLAASAALRLQPICFSYFLLAVLLWLLWRYQNRLHPEEPPAFRQELRRLGWVLALLVLWVNVDSWFMMGLFVIGLFWIGSWFDPRVACPGWLFPAAVGVCLFNPHHFHALCWPAELSPVLWTTGLRLDPRFQGPLVSPWMVGAHLQPAAAIHLGQWGFFLLVLLGIVSFVLVRRNLSGWRGAVWLGLLIVGSWQVGLMPFFAVAAAPITAMNFQQWLQDRRRLQAGTAVLGRLGLLAACLALIVLTWRGWLHGFHDDGHRIAWGAQANPSLERAARALARWQEEELLPVENPIFTTHPEAAHYLAWFAPGQKGFLDHRIPLFAQRARDFERVCAALDPSLAVSARSAAGPETLERIFRSYGISHVLVYDPILDRVLSIQHRLTDHPDDWALLRIDGQAVLHGWKHGPAEGDTALAFRPDQKAFADNQDADEQWQAPGQGPDQPPHRPTAWVWPGTRVTPPSWESPASSVCLMTDGGSSPALPLLAIRAARRAVAADPLDAQAYLNLAQAYLVLHTQADGPFQEPDGSPLSQVRHIQIVTAVENALRLQPDQEIPHLRLADLYTRRQYLDIALEHQREAGRRLRLTPPSYEPAALAELLDRAEQVEEELQQAVERQQQELQSQSAPAEEGTLARAQRALKLGLPLHALHDLQAQADTALLNRPGYTLELELLLMLGRADTAQALIQQADREQKLHRAHTGQVESENLAGLPPAYDWLLVCLSVANGDYEQADAFLQRQEAQQAVWTDSQRKDQRRQGLITLAIEIGLNGQRQPFLPEISHRNTVDWAQRWQAAAQLHLGQADLAEVTALLALEWGKPASARSSFQKALGLLPTLPQEGSGELARRRLALAYLHLIDRASASPPR